MKQRIFLTISAAILLVLAAASTVDASSIIRVKVPFAFTFGNVSVPAGTYTVYKSPAVVLTLTDEQANRWFVPTFAGDYARGDKDAKLVFRRYGDQYFLYEIFDGTALEGSRIPTSKLEREYIKQASKVTANNQRQPETIAIYALAR